MLLAAGLGTRFGGAKQLTAVGPGAEWLSDYTLVDAAAAGADAAVFVLAEGHEPAVRDHHRRCAPPIRVRYLIQRLDDLPAGRHSPAGRLAPWGTAHALLTAAPSIQGPFVAVNADDYYGPSAFIAVQEFLRFPSRHSARIAMVGYPLAETLSAHGAVSRAV